MIDVTLNITLKLRGPIISKSTSAGGFGIDAVFARDEHDNPVLPRGLIKGKLRQSVQELADLGVNLGSDWISKYLGNDSGNRGLLDISPFRFPKNSKDVRYRIEIDDMLGAAKKGSFQVIEMIADSAEEIDAIGEVKFFAEDEKAAGTLAEEILKAFAFVTSFGADKSTGFGELIGLTHEMTQRQLSSTKELNTFATADQLQFCLKPDSPFCIAKPRRYNNIFESETIIPGNVIKGCIANTWAAFWNKANAAISTCLSPPPGAQDYEKLKEHFEKIRFSHAFPTKNAAVRPVVIPYSIVDANGNLKDVANETKAKLFNGRAPAFQIDWKNEVWDKANPIFGWDYVPRKFEVRNAHNRKRRKAKDQDLFAYEMIVPTDHYWLGTVDFSRVPTNHRAAVAQEFQHLIDCLKDLRFLGKTKARAKIDVCSTPFASKVNPKPERSKFVVMLQSDALLADPYLTNKGSISTEDELRAAYKSAWEDISGGTLKLENYFAGQHLAGGDYIAKTFLKGKAYNPFFLTNAGSVFVLTDTGTNSTREDSKDKSASKLISEWLKTGLPLPKWAEDRHGGSWDENPYIPENGYGEISVNLEHGLNGGEN